MWKGLREKRVMTGTVTWPSSDCLVRLQRAPSAFITARARYCICRNVHVIEAFPQRQLHGLSRQALDKEVKGLMQNATGVLQRINRANALILTANNTLAVQNKQRHFARNATHGEAGEDSGMRQIPF